METITVDTWLTSVLKADTTLMALVPNVYSFPGTNLTYPSVVFQEQSVVDVRGVGPSRIMIDGLWLVRGIVETTTFLGLSESIANRIDFLLQAKKGTIPSGSIWGCARVRPFRLVETVLSRQYRHLGGIYRIYAK